jgi:glyoxylase-like metal-dependent hydrolase (beta-lactamase superfamily II)
MMKKIVALLLLPVCALAGPLDQPWNEGAADCKTASVPPIEIHAYDPRTYILRESLCATFEAPFLYLLIGEARALLIDSGDVADPQAMPLAETVRGLLPDKLPLLVVHTHRHLDHRAGDGQFAGLPDVEIAGYDLDGVKRFYGFTDWPEGVAQLDLGGRLVEALPTPGHNETEVSFYDRVTGLFFSGDFLLPGRLLIEDGAADLASARRVEAFLAERPVTAVLGAHIEMDKDGALFPWESRHHPNEHGLALTKADVAALAEALRHFNGFYGEAGPWVMMDGNRLALCGLAGVATLAAAAIYGLARFLRRRRTDTLV